MSDPATLHLLWWALAALMLLCFALLDGFDIGIALLLPLVAHSDSERQMAVMALDASWQANPLWMLLGGGAIMLAWPMYATGFSVFYLALLLTLCALFLRPFGFALRERIPDRWRELWDWALFCGGLLPALFYGLAAGSLFTGALQQTATSFSRATLHPFSVYCAVLSTLLLMLHGAAMLLLRTQQAVQQRARRTVMLTGGALALLFSAGGLWLEQMQGLRMNSVAAEDLHMLWIGTGVTINNGAWLDNYQRWPWLWLAPATSVLAPLATAVAAAAGGRWLVFLGSSVTLGAILVTGVLALFPFVMPATTWAHQPQALWQALDQHRLLPALMLLLAVLAPCAVAWSVRAYHRLRPTAPLRATKQGQP